MYSADPAASVRVRVIIDRIRIGINSPNIRGVSILSQQLIKNEIQLKTLN